MPELYQRPYLDALCWISVLSGHGDYAQDLGAVLYAADRGELVIVMSDLMPLEVLGGRHGERTPESAGNALAALNRSSLLHVAAGRRVVAEARQLRLEHELDSMDALHLASAVVGKADVYLTEDKRVGRLSSYRGVRIMKPEWPGDMPLPKPDPDPAG